jgi:hypothetical protein
VNAGAVACRVHKRAACASYLIAELSFFWARKAPLPDQREVQGTWPISPVRFGIRASQPCAARLGFIRLWWPNFASGASDLWTR